MLEVVVFQSDGNTKRVSSGKSSLMIGKASGNDICIEAEGVSRYHARLSVEDGAVVVEDLGSTNGTYVNSEQVQKAKVSPSDKIAVGNTLVTVELVVEEEEEEEEAPTPEQPEEEDTSTMAHQVDTAAEEAPEAHAEIHQAAAESLSASSKSDDFYWKSMANFLGPIWHYQEDETVSEIMINGPEEIYIERKGRLQLAPEKFTEGQLHAAILNIAQYVGRRVSEEEPYLDARLPDGSRVAVLLQPCSRKGAAVAIRKFSKEALTLEKLIGFGSMTPDMALFLKACVVLKKNIVISGGTSSGKTSLLNVVSGLVPDDERIITIEDSAELQLTQDHVVPMETKPPDKKGRGQVTIRDLVKVSLRMRPDRVIVGEIRGGEAIDLLQAMNTGHSGSMCTIHANSPRQSLSRMETLSLFSGLEIPMLALREQVSSAIDIVIQAARLPDHSRKVTHITEIGQLQEGGIYVVNDIYKFVREGLTEDKKIIGGHKWTGNVPSFVEEMELAGLDDVLGLFSNKKGE
ncbi:MAG: Flp pilus assembly complex ATPase component TadA [Bdellovibrionales bacterium]|nr:Flp pilus assembly complex ATPase component TadA [Bdellovibrionales bacterium]